MLQPLHGRYLSGAPAIFIDQCGRIGGSAAMIGAEGADDFGRMLNLNVNAVMKTVHAVIPHMSARGADRPRRGAMCR